MHELASKLVQWLKFYNVLCELAHVRLFKSVRILENFVKRGYMRLNKRPCAAIRDVRMFEVVQYKSCNTTVCNTQCAPTLEMLWRRAIFWLHV